jgi:hypothetical protein
MSRAEIYEVWNARSFVRAFSRQRASCLKSGSKVANAEKVVLGASLWRTINVRETPAGRDVVRRCREPALATRGISIDGGAPGSIALRRAANAGGFQMYTVKSLSLICDRQCQTGPNVPGTAG